MRVRTDGGDSLRSWAERCEVHKTGKCFATGARCRRDAEEPNMRGCRQQRHMEEAAATKETSSQSRIEGCGGWEHVNKQDKQEEKAKDQKDT